MKKIFALLFVGTLAFGMMACGHTETEPTGTSMPESATLPDDMKKMIEPIDALARCTLEQGRDYDSQDPSFVWLSLSYFAGAYGNSHPLVYIDEETYQAVVISPVMEDFAAALFADYTALPAPPEDLADRVSYDADMDTYYLATGDIGMSKTILTSCEETEDGYAVKAELWGVGPEEELICAYDVILVKNPNLADASLPLYHYSVQSITPANA